MTLNKVTLIGHLTGTPRVKRLPSGERVATFVLATTSRWQTMMESVDFHTIVTRRALADIVARYVKKGDRLFVEGRLRTNPSRERTSGVEVIADQIIMLGRRSAHRSTDDHP
jgi:single-strand DNA-binding protein